MRPPDDAALPGLGERTLVMGVLNATDDSFSGDGLGDDVDGLAALGARMAAEGADLLDIGAASSRPGHGEVPTVVELRRATAAVAALRGATPVPISIDSTRRPVVEGALRAGATMVNDVSGLADPALAALAAEHGAWLVIVHSAESLRSRGERDAEPAGIVDDVLPALDRAARDAVAAGVARDRILVDPGLGFRKTPAESFALLAAVGRLRTIAPVLVGPSRKAHLGAATDRGVGERVHATSAAMALAVANGADVIRGHEVAAALDAARVADATRRGLSAARSRVAYIGLGANLGDRRAVMARAVAALATVGTVTAVSGLWETAPMYVTDQPAFLNAVAAVTVRDRPGTLVARLKGIERWLGREPGRRRGERAIDLDLCAFADGTAVERDGDVVVPHPALGERRFVLAPLAELAPGLVDAGSGRRIGELLAAVSEQAAERLEGPAWTTS